MEMDDKWDYDCDYLMKPNEKNFKHYASALEC